MAGPARGYLVIVPPYVRLGLVSRIVNHTDLLPQIHLPMLEYAERFNRELRQFARGWPDPPRP